MNIIITNHSYDTVISGGDVIACEFAKCWKNNGHSVIIATHKSCANFLKSRSVSNEMIDVVFGAQAERFGLVISGIVKSISGIFQALFFKKIKPDIIFSSSWMWPDLFPAIILKIRFPKAKLVTGCYLILPSPNTKSYGSSFISRYIFWFVYIIGFYLMRKISDKVWTASEFDAKYLITKYGIDAFAVRGGVDAESGRKAKNEKKVYDGVFMGRFHPQKNIFELIDIWKMIVEKLPSAKLVLIGDGFLREKIINYINDYNLKKNIEIMEMIDGNKKFKIFGQSKLFMTTSHFDSGNLSLDEALSCGTPGIAYNLVRMNYPKGVIKISGFNTEEFTDQTISLITNKLKIDKLSSEAFEFGQTLDWSIISNKAFSSLNIK